MKEISRSVSSIIRKMRNVDTTSTQTSTDRAYGTANVPGEGGLRSSKLNIKRSTILVLIVAIAGGLYVWRGVASDTSMRIASGENDLVIKYEIGMADAIKENEFSNEQGPAMLLYSNGLMLCGNNDHSDMTEKQSEALNLHTKQLSTKSSQALVNALDRKGFKELAKNAAANAEGLAHNVGSTILVNTTSGALVANNLGSNSQKFTAVEDILKKECAGATSKYNPDDIVVETIKQSGGKTSETLPSAVTVQSAVGRPDSQKLKGSQAKQVKSKLSKKARLFKAADGSTVKARYLPKVPEFNQPTVVSPDQNGKVHAANLSKTKWLYVVAADQGVPSNAASVLTEHAQSIAAFYKAKVGKTFSIDQLQVVRGKKTAAQYRVCPSKMNCQSNVALAITYNLADEFKASGYSTNMFHSFDASNGCMGWGGGTSWYSTDPERTTYAVTPLKGCNWYNGSHTIAAHEAGHSFALPHTCDSNLMSSCSYSRAAFPYTTLQSSQAVFLRDKSPFFKAGAVSKPPEVMSASSLKADFNNDGYSDILWYAPGSAADYLWYGTRDRTKFRSVPVSIAGTYSPFTGDFNGDGYSDVYWYGPGDTQESVWYGTSQDGKFESKSVVQITGSYKPVVGDFNGDRYDDVLFYAPGSATDSIHYGTSTKGAFDRSATTTNMGGNHKPIPGDFNGDGRGDVLFYTAGDAYDYVRYGTSSKGVFTSSVVEVNAKYRPVPGDFNGDGKGDVYWYSPGTATDYLWYGTSTMGSFTNITSPKINGTYIPVPGDFDGDKFDDVFFYGQGNLPDYIHFGTATRGQIIDLPATSVVGTYMPLPE